MANSMECGKVFFVGAGPGDPGLITVKGLRCLQQADVIVYDRLINPRLLENAKSGAELFCVGKEAGKHLLPQDEINNLLFEKAREGKTVVRLKGGDPFVFGRGGEETLFLMSRGITFEIVPGVTAGTAVPAYAGIPVSHRGIASSIAFITGHEDPMKEDAQIDWGTIPKAADTLVFFMSVKNIGEVVAKLIDEGRSADTPAAVIEWGTLPRQRTIKGALSEIGDLVERTGVRPPAILVVGNVVRLRDSLNWYENKPLFGKRVLVTRPREQASELSELIESLGGEAVLFPVIRTVEIENFTALDAGIEDIGSFDWVLFTSANGVRFFLKRISERGLDARIFGKAKLCAIGPATAKELQRHMLRADLIPTSYVADDVLRCLNEAGEIAGKRFLLPRAQEARRMLPEKLRQLGGEVRELAAYRTLLDETHSDEEIAELMRLGVDVATFTSPSCVRCLHVILGEKRFRELLGRSAIACIGPVTEETLRQFGLEPRLVASQYTTKGLVEAIVQYARVSFN